MHERVLLRALRAPIQRANAPTRQASRARQVYMLELRGGMPEALGLGVGGVGRDWEHLAPPTESELSLARP